LETALLASASTPVARETSLARDFSAGFERCFGRVYAYVSRRVSERTLCECIVREVLTANLDLLVNGSGEPHLLARLQAASDRLIGSEPARSLSTGTNRP